MTLLITIFAAVICTIIWYRSLPADDMKIGFMALMFWGASLMWMVDAVFEYVELKSEFFMASAQDMLNDACLGICVVALGLIIWLAVLLITDPKGVIKDALTSRN